MSTLLNLIIASIWTPVSLWSRYTLKATCGVATRAPDTGGGNCLLSERDFNQPEYRVKIWYTRKMHLSPSVALLLSVLRWWFYCCWFVVDCYSHYGIL